MKFKAMISFKPKTVNSVIATFTDTIKELEELDNAACERSQVLGDKIASLAAERSELDREGARARGYATKLRQFFGE